MSQKNIELLIVMGAILVSSLVSMAPLFIFADKISFDEWQKSSIGLAMGTAGGGAVIAATYKAWQGKRRS